MKFSTRTDIAAPQDFVFDQLADFASFERAAMRRGIKLSRLDTLQAPAAGMSWDVAFRLRGKERQVVVDVRRFERSSALEFAGTSSSFELRLTLTVVAVAPGRARLQVELEVKPRTLAARLMIQSAKIGRKTLDRKFDDRVATFGTEIERRAAQARV
ncbi:SRPBCC family protein [Thioclava sp. A2]|uniref:SRPBCC family protein n=1 Tax=Thioclava sp. FCG-A2 TaxID=3080562 RepID=UPI00295528DE|nr:SRPBCC family protein [Thioclava sp. A2]MDV7270329.1 SRPBCC family protein [Thioclava sp. A2]